jgi:hypothetical protein
MAYSSTSDCQDCLVMQTKTTMPSTQLLAAFDLPITSRLKIINIISNPILIDMQLGK